LPSVKSSCCSLKDIMLVFVSLSLASRSAIYLTTMTSFSSLFLTTCLALALQSATCFVAAPCKSLVGSNSMEMHMFRRNTAKASSEPSRGKAVQITEITRMEDFIKFLGQDDRLCVVK
jgi:hypothetical protein